MKTLKLKSRGRTVALLQELLGITQDGIFGPNTEEAVKNFQKEKGLVVDGIMGPNSWKHLLSDVEEKSFTTPQGQTIFPHYLDPGQYRTEVGAPRQIFLHHTAGWENPFAVIDDWNRRPGRVATEFVIGGKKVTDGSNEHDGVVLQAFPKGCNGFHVGIKARTKNEMIMNLQSIGIELASFGYLTDDNRTYVGHSADIHQIVKLRTPFRGYKKWHKYSSAQIESLRLLLLYLSERDNIDIQEGLPHFIRKYGPASAFEYKIAAAKGDVRGILSHSNVRKDKFDCSPQPELVDMLLNL